MNSQFPLWFSYLVAISSIVFGFGTLLVLYMNKRLALQLKRADVLIECGRRFDNLLAMEEKLDPEAYFKRLWTLQYDQYVHWRQKYIDDHHYILWLKERHAEYWEEKRFGDVTYKQGWEMVSSTLRDEGFLEHIALVFDGDIHEAMDFARRSWPLRLLNR